MKTAKVAVVGAAGYGGAEIVRLLQTHPFAEVSTVSSSRSAGKLLRSECPWLSTDLTLVSYEPDTIEADLVFLCQESGFAMREARKLSAKSKVVDLSADFRLNDKQVFFDTYRIEHKDPELTAVYGLPELVDPDAINDAELVANPGCYPTASLLALMPLVRAGLVRGTPIVDAKSGVSGAGRSRNETEYLFGELDGGFKAYKVLGHRHTPEIEQMAGMRVRFTPHLIPAARGIHATVYVQLDRDIDILGLYRDFYGSSPFVTIQDAPPSTKQVRGSNRCDIFPVVDPTTDIAVVCSVIDNLVKGAAGQAIQNMNLMLGFPEAAGLPLDGVWP